MDTHTAIAWAASDKYLRDGGLQTKNGFYQPSDLYKFTGSVLALRRRSIRSIYMQIWRVLSEINTQRLLSLVIF